VHKSMSTEPQADCARGKTSEGSSQKNKPSRQPRTRVLSSVKTCKCKAEVEPVIVNLSIKLSHRLLNED